MAKQLIIDLTDEQAAALASHLQYLDNPKESLEELLQELILINYLNPMMATQIRTDEVKKIEAVIDQKIDDTIYKKPEPVKEIIEK